MNDQLTAVRQIAQMMYDGVTVLEDSRDEFWKNTRSETRNAGFVDLGSVTVTYLPRAVEKNSTMIGVSLGRAFDNSIREYPERIADAVRRVHEELYQTYFLDVRSMLANQVSELVGRISCPKHNKSFVINASNLPEMRNKLYAFRIAAEKNCNESLVDSIMNVDMGGFSDYQESSPATLHFMRAGYGCAFRTAGQALPPDVLDIGPLLHWLGDPATRAFNRSNIEAVLDYIEKL